MPFSLAHSPSPFKQIEDDWHVKINIHFNVKCKKMREFLRIPKEEQKRCEKKADRDARATDGGASISAFCARMIVA